MGELLIDWTARVAVGCYLLRALSDAGVLKISRRYTLQIWTIGAVIFLLHVLAAFHFEHHWSHAGAYRHTAEQTAVAIGWKSGFGLYLNYATLFWWITDALLCWVPFNQFESTGRRYRIAFHTYFGFMVFNATVVFGPRGWRVVGLVFGFLLARYFIRRKPAIDE